MEIVLQWLDDLDDVVFALVLAWERLRRRCVEFGALAALALAACVPAAVEWIPLLAAVAGFSIAIALVGAAVAAVAEAVSGPAPRA